MTFRTLLSLIIFTSVAVTAAQAQAAGPGSAPVTRPTLLLQETLDQLPRGARQEVRVLTAEFPPAGQTVFHTHRFPVTVYVLQGEFRLELDGRPARTVKAGEAMVEPASVRMTGYNASATEPLRVVIFYVSDPGTPFLDPITPTGAPH